jgi:hypothetical protein
LKFFVSAAQLDYGRLDAVEVIADAIHGRSEFPRRDITRELQEAAVCICIRCLNDTIFSRRFDRCDGG